MTYGNIVFLYGYSYKKSSYNELYLKQNYAIFMFFDSAASAC